LGIGIYFLALENMPDGTFGPQVGFVDCIRVDIFSDSLEQDANSVLRALRFLRNQDFFKTIEKKNIIFGQIVVVILEIKL
jgi:hypothetical protein